MDVIPVSDQASKVQRCRRAADLERQHGHFVDDPLLNGQPVQLVAGIVVHSSYAMLLLC